MKYLSAVLALALIGCQTTAKPRGGPVEPTQKVKTFLGDKMLPVLQAPDSIQAIQVEPRAGVSLENIDGFKILNRGPMLSADQTLLLKGLIMDEKSYDFANVKRHPMDPIVAFQFKKGTNVVNVLVSYAGNLWQFTGFDQKQIEDNDPVRASLVGLAKELFPKDKDIQALEVKQ